MKLPEPAPKWFAYYLAGGDCYHVSWGHPQGPKLPFETIERWAIERVKKSSEPISLYAIAPIGALAHVYYKANGERMK